MIRTIALKDLREFARDGRMMWAAALIILLSVVALASGWIRQSQINSERTAGQALDYQAWLQQGERHPHDAAEQGMHVFKPEPPLSVLDPGIEPFVGSTVWLQAHRQSELKFRPAQDATGLQRFGQLSPAWIVQVLVPLLIIVIGFNAISGERERGTLRQLTSIGVPARKLLLGKAIALGACAAALVLPVWVAFSAFAISQLPSVDRLDIVYRMLSLLAGYSFYLGFFVFLTIAVSAWVRSSRAAVVLLLGFWVAATLIAPRSASELANAVYPTPSRLAFTNELSHDISEAAGKAWKSTFNVEAQWDPSLPLNKWGAALKVDDHAGYGVLDQTFGKLWDTFEHQQQLQQWIGFVAPVITLRSFSMGLAGTDFAQHRDFSTAAEKQRRKIQDIVSDDLVAHADTLGNAHFSYKAGPALWASIPEFKYQLPTIGFAASRYWADLLFLAAMCGIATAFASLAVSRTLSRVS